MRAWLRRWREDRREARWRKLRIPADVRARMEKAGVYDAPDWYAGRQTDPLQREQKP